MTVHPPPPARILDAAKHGKLVVFVGAGASRLCGSPDWSGFATGVVNALQDKKVLNHLEAEQLRKFSDPRRTLSIAMSLADLNKVKIDVDRILHGTSQNPDGLNLYKVLKELQPVFVTTNYDKWLHALRQDDAVPTTLDASVSPILPRFSKAEHFLAEHLTPEKLAKPGTVIHLHGTYIDQASMVVTLRQYIQHYAHEGVQTFLKAMFKNYTVLFLGYGLAELELLEYIVRANELTGQHGGSQHFLLYAHQSNEAKQTEYVEHFLREQCGVEVIRYCIDEKGYPELVDVLKTWRNHIEVREPGTLDYQLLIDGFVKEPTATNREAAIQLVQRQPELTSYFLNALNSETWFNDLDNAGLFSVEHSPSLEEVPGREGHFMAHDWPAIRYLERITVQSGLSGHIAARTAEIVRAVSNDGQARKLENWRTWWALATIFAYLPLSEIKDSDIELVRFWIGGRFDASMAGQVLGEKLLPRLIDSVDPEDLEKALLLTEVLTELKPGKADT